MILYPAATEENAELLMSQFKVLKLLVKALRLSGWAFPMHLKVTLLLLLKIAKCSPIAYVYLILYICVCQDEIYKCIVKVNNRILSP